MHESLLMRRKGQHLNDGQIYHIIKLIETSPKNWKHLQKKYKLSRATLRRIIHQKNKGATPEDSSLVRFKENKKISKDAERLIRCCLLPPCEPKSVPIVKKYIESKLNESYSKQEIRNYIKNEMKYSYRKENSRPPVYAEKRTQLIKALFCTELLSLIANGEVIINWDESSFDRSVKQLYSWLPVGESWQIINDRLKCRASLILATWNTGEWLAMIVMSTVNSDKFWFFLKLLSKIISRRFANTQKPPIIIIDNASTHLSGITQEVISKLDLQVKFGASYWPEVAPVERIFGKIKSKLRVMGRTTVIDFNKSKGAELIFQLIGSISKDSWLKSWKEVIKEGRKSIVEILVKKSTNGESLESTDRIRAKSAYSDKMRDE